MSERTATEVLANQNVPSDREAAIEVLKDRYEKYSRVGWDTQAERAKERLEALGGDVNASTETEVLADGDVDGNDTEALREAYEHQAQVVTELDALGLTERKEKAEAKREALKKKLAKSGSPVETMGNADDTSSELDSLEGTGMELDTYASPPVGAIWGGNISTVDL